MKVALTHRTWGAWPSVMLSTEAVELEVVSEVGARVVSLRDRRRDREWLVQGQRLGELEQKAWAREEAVFAGRESFGWDECLPTTAPCADPLSAGVGLHRRISFADESTVQVDYLLQSLAEVPLPIHWAQHPVLKVEPGSYIDLPEVHTARRSWQNGIDLPDELTWPKATLVDGSERDLGCVRTGEGWAAVLYATAREGARVVAPDGARLDFEWDMAFAPALRVWLSYGGWPPEDEPSEQIALEPCTSMHDHLEGAMADGQERILPAGGELRWWVRLQLS